MTYSDLAPLMQAVGLAPAARPWPDSPHRFPDGARHHVEIPSVEGPAVLRAVIDEATRQGLRVHRVSQGSGVLMLSDAELDEMAALGREHDIEVCLFLGPRGSWDAGGQAMRTEAAAGVARGAEAVEACIAEARRACAHGIRSLLVGDVGVLDVLARLRAAGHLPADLVFKTSAIMCAAVVGLAVTRAMAAAQIASAKAAQDELASFGTPAVIPDRYSDPWAVPAAPATAS